VAEWTGRDGTLARDAKWLAAAGSGLSAALLTADLGRPERFINMLRVFKPQSAMSVGSWTLTAFSATSTAALLPENTGIPGSAALTKAAGASSAMLGAGMLTYTGVLIGATAIPVWNQNVRLLPIHFAASGVASAVAILTLLGHDEPALNDLAVGAAAVETVIGAIIETKDRSAGLKTRATSERDADSASQGGRATSDRNGAASGRADVMSPLRDGPSGLVIRVGGVLSGPVPLLLRTLTRDRSWRTVASIAALAGSLLTRIGWIAAGRASAG
jgi:formate-dependent nitrite reductase membrane component NrfD